MNLDKFYDSVRNSITLTNENVRGFDFIIVEGLARKIHLNDLAYILATTFHETAARMQPIAEYGKGKGRKYGVKGKYGQVPYGRGYVQLTWDSNYEKADKKLNLKGALLRDFNLALDPKIAIQILFIGMEEGWFTGKKLRDFIDTIDEDDDEDKREFIEGRRIINGVDKKILIAGYGIIFEKALRSSGYEDISVIIKEEPKIVTPTLEPEVKSEIKIKKWYEIVIEIIVEYLKRSK